MLTLRQRLCRKLFEYLLAQKRKVEYVSQMPVYMPTHIDLSVERGEIDLALQILSAISSDQPYFVEAKTRMADIYKRYKNDLQAYARCYSELCSQNPTVKSWLLLGDAYTSIQEPEKAIAVYERAFEDNPTAVVLAIKIGKALVKTHDYKKAVKYYEHALTTSIVNPSLQYDLADLYRKLGQYDNAELVISNALDHPNCEELSN